MTDLKEIGKKINDLVKMVKDKFDKGELESFIDYISKTDVLGPLIAPEQWRKLPGGAIDEARKRATLLLKIKALKDFSREEKGDTRRCGMRGF